MKNINFAFSLIFLLFFSNSSFAQTDDLSVIELSLDVKEFKKYIAKGEMNKPLPFVIISNDYFSEYLDIDFEGKKLVVFANKNTAELEEDEIFLEVKKFKIRDNIAIFKFKYNGYTIKIKHQKKEGKWAYKSFSLKGNKKRYFHSGTDN